jgi:hypothetical protein
VIWYRLQQALHRLAMAFCRHPEGVRCLHRQLLSDSWLAGYRAGVEFGRAERGRIRDKP